MGDIHQDMKKKMEVFDKALTMIEKRVSPFVSSPLDEVMSQLTPVENAKLNMAYGYAINSLFYMYLKTQGVSPDEHPVKKDLERIKRYMAKTMAADKKTQDKDSLSNNEETAEKDAKPLSLKKEEKEVLKEDKMEEEEKDEEQSSSVTKNIQKRKSPQSNSKKKRKNKKKRKR
mmetsp:Transcript_7702/g.8840  ORF Transcript_7702/g.8840 Transcript_7702/m.8840 type:complete len:173 (-) Transcript_7702:59-577(-)